MLYLHVGKGCSISGRVGNAKENSLVYVIIYSLFIMSFYFFSSARSSLRHDTLLGAVIEPLEDFKCIYRTTDHLLKFATSPNTALVSQNRSKVQTTNTGSTQLRQRTNQTNSVCQTDNSQKICLPSMLCHYIKKYIHIIYIFWHLLDVRHTSGGGGVGGDSIGSAGLEIFY